MAAVKSQRGGGIVFGPTGLNGEEEEEEGSPEVSIRIRILIFLRSQNLPGHFGDTCIISKCPGPKLWLSSLNQKCQLEVTHLVCQWGIIKSESYPSLTVSMIFLFHAFNIFVFSLIRISYLWLIQWLKYVNFDHHIRHKWIHWIQHGNIHEKAQTETNICITEERSSTEEHICLFVI